MEISVNPITIKFELSEEDALLLWYSLRDDVEVQARIIDRLQPVLNELGMI